MTLASCDATDSRASFRSCSAPPAVQHAAVVAAASRCLVAQLLAQEALSACTTLILCSLRAVEIHARRQVHAAARRLHVRLAPAASRYQATAHPMQQGLLGTLTTVLLGNQLRASSPADARAAPDRHARAQARNLILLRLWMTPRTLGQPTAAHLLGLLSCWSGPEVVDLQAALPQVVQHRPWLNRRFRRLLERRYEPLCKWRKHVHSNESACARLDVCVRAHAHAARATGFACGCVGKK